MPVIDQLLTKDFIELEELYGAHNYHPLDVVIERAEGVWVYDVDGKRYLDCLAVLFCRQPGPLPS
jgi:ornithine--oxo-acid transaminase